MSSLQESGGIPAHSEKQTPKKSPQKKCKKKFVFVNGRDFHNQSSFNSSVRLLMSSTKRESLPFSALSGSNCLDLGFLPWYNFRNAALIQKSAAGSCRIPAGLFFLIFSIPKGDRYD